MPKHGLKYEMYWNVQTPIKMAPWNWPSTRLRLSLRACLSSSFGYVPLKVTTKGCRICHALHLQLIALHKNISTLFKANKNKSHSAWHVSSAPLQALHSSTLCTLCIFLPLPVTLNYDASPHQARAISRASIYWCMCKIWSQRPHLFVSRVMRSLLLVLMRATAVC